MCSEYEDVTRTFRNDAGAPSAARQLVAHAAGHGHVSAERRDTAILLASELASNCLLHTQAAEMIITVSCSGTTLAIAVTDTDHSIPEVRAGDAFEPGGRGLALVDRLASRWGTRPLPNGKEVWCIV